MISAALLSLLPACFLFPTPWHDEPDCQCVWEGPLDAELVRYGVDGETLFLQTDLTWSPCCADGASETRVYAVEVASAATWEVAEMPSLATDEGTYGDDDVEVEFPSLGLVAVLYVQVQESVLEESLVVGIVAGADTREMVGEIVIDTAR